MVKTAQSEDFGSSIHTQTAYFSDPTHKARSTMDLHVVRTRRAYFTGLPSLPLPIRHFPDCMTRGESRITRSQPRSNTMGNVPALRRIVIDEGQYRGL